MHSDLRVLRNYNKTAYGNFTVYVHFRGEIFKNIFFVFNFNTKPSEFANRNRGGEGTVTSNTLHTYYIVVEKRGT